MILYKDIGSMTFKADKQTLLKQLVKKLWQKLWKTYGPEASGIFFMSYSMTISRDGVECFSQKMFCKLRWGTEFKNSFTISFFSYPPPISLELLIPQKWFAYRCLQRWARYTITLLNGNFLYRQFLLRKWKTYGEKNLYFFFRPTLTLA